MTKKVKVIGCGLAGAEASYQLAKRGFLVEIYEQKPYKFSPAHTNPNFAELVCSNSLKSNELNNSCGLLKQELRELDSLVIKVADKVSVPSGSALSVDRELFAKEITETLKSMPNIKIFNECVESIDFNEPTIIATGPLTEEVLFKNLKEVLGDDDCYFFDAIAPIVSKRSLDENCYFIANRYDKGEGDGDYINCPMNKEEYSAFYDELIKAKVVDLKDFENKKVFESCMPIEVSAKRGFKTLLFGILKPKGLIDPKTGKMPYACLQLRKESNLNDLYNLVGCQTNMLYVEQKRIFSLIPALKNAEFIRYGEMHRNSYINAPKHLNKFYQLKKYPNVFIAGQLSGVEGYVESISSGLYSAINMANMLNKEPFVEFSGKTAIGSLPNYISSANENRFQPMNSNWGIIVNNGEEKLERAKIALEEIKNYVKGDKNGTI
ncbi:MAG TPA: methylenetetrahydrofolate--tRNA-(uracil(54)-C(5))-methyltransferase (FADH(2)-oxidizing) TrmFO [Clostridiales bacterium]|nr:methylenetetrahydrofolate--tRNA-(uracil(54)-C(5))-methyltransferase (FADH(2)-oxidizing) TrmFO [Clostridiales bacterium]